jgi:hypothetical protein
VRERSKPTVDVVRARALLDALLLSLEPRNAVTVRDSAKHMYNAPGIATTDKARAAFVLGNAFFQLNDRTEGCRWVRMAMELDFADSTYGKLVAQCQR